MKDWNRRLKRAARTEPNPNAGNVSWIWSTASMSMVAFRSPPTRTPRYYRMVFLKKNHEDRRAAWAKTEEGLARLFKESMDLFEF